MVRKLRRTVAVAEQGTVSTLCSARVRLWHKGESFGTTANCVSYMRCFCRACEVIGTAHLTEWNFTDR